MSLAYAPTTRNIDHTKFVALTFAFHYLLMILLFLEYTNAVQNAGPKVSL